MDEKVGAVPFGARLLFQSIWTQSDLRGVFEYSAKQLRVCTFPFDEDVGSAQVQKWLDRLEEIGLIARFEADGKSWGYVRKWEKHQTISGREKEIDTKLSKAKRRPVPSCCSQGVPGECLGSTHAATLTLTPAPTPTIAQAGPPALSDSPIPEIITPKATDDPDEDPFADADAGNPIPLKEPSSAQRFTYEVHNLPWYGQLTGKGCHITKRDWKVWATMINDHGVEKVIQAALQCTRRYADQIAEKLNPSQAGGSDLAKLVRKTFISGLPPGVKCFLSGEELLDLARACGNDEMNRFMRQCRKLEEITSQCLVEFRDGIRSQYSASWATKPAYRLPVPLTDEAIGKMLDPKNRVVAV